MKPEDIFKKNIKTIRKLLLSFVLVFLMLIGGLFFFIRNETTKNTTIEAIESSDYVEISKEDDFDKIENGIHVATGFVEGDGLMLVVQNCTSCHSAKLVTQNRMSKEKWLATIRWMQESQNLWDLGVNEAPILDYLSTYYAPNQIGRRANLTDIDWYELK
ncbi:MAG: monoheme cytochrome C [Cellulophaga sp.]|nr:monoheme cytochrome C [Cellulophaga sp.]